MKKTVCLITFLISFSSLAEMLNCKSDNGVWEVNGDISEDRINQLVFIKNGEVVKQFQSLPVHSFNFWLPGKGKFKYYEIALGGSKYFDLDRPYRAKILSQHAEGEFLLTNNPVGLAKYVSCQFIKN